MGHQHSNNLEDNLCKNYIILHKNKITKKLGEDQSEWIDMYKKFICNFIFVF